MIFWYVFGIFGCFRGKLPSKLKNAANLNIVPNCGSSKTKQVKYAENS